jgi:hypothetical protein
LQLQFDGECMLLGKLEYVRLLSHCQVAELLDVALSYNEEALARLYRTGRIRDKVKEWGGAAPQGEG